MKKTEFVENMKIWLGDTRHCSFCQHQMKLINESIKKGIDTKIKMKADKNHFGQITHRHIEMV